MAREALEDALDRERARARAAEARVAELERELAVRGDSLAAGSPDPARGSEPGVGSSTPPAVDFLGLITAAMRRSTEGLSEATDPSTIVPGALAAVGELVGQLGIIDLGVVEYLGTTRTVAVRGILRHGVVLPLSDIDFASREWSVDEPALRVPWERIREGRFVWGLVDDATVLHPAARDFHVASGAKAVAYQPLKRGGEAIGWLAFVLQSDAPPDETLVGLLQALSSQMFLAMEMQRVAGLAQRAALERARAEAAEVSAAQVQTANDAMRRAVDRLAQNPDLESFLGFLLLEIGSRLGSETAAITTYFEVEDAFRAGVVLHDGEISPLDPMTAVLQRTDVAFLDRLLHAEGFALFDTERDGALFWPGPVESLRSRGERYSVSFAIRVDGRLYGQISLAYADEPKLSSQQAALVQALSTQAALAIQLTRLANESRSAETAAAIATERNRMAEQRMADLGKANEAIRLALAALAAEPAPQAIEIMFREIVRAAGADAGYWFRYDDGLHTLCVTLRIDRGALLTAPAIDEPELFRGPFPADVTPAFEVLCHDSSFVKLSTHVDSDLMWPGTPEWHRRRGRTEALAFAVKVGAAPLGVIGLSFTDRTTMSDVQEHLVRTLSNQFALAVQMSHLAEQAKRAEVDRETGRAIATERNRMAGEIHDSLAQAFTSIALQTEAMLLEIDDGSPLRESLSVVEETARIGLAEARSSVLALRAVGEQPGDLELALASLASRCTIPGTLECRFRSEAPSSRLSAEARDALLRVAQEAVANALRHARARVVDIHYEAVDGRATLSIRDDGVGMSGPSSSERRGLGVSGMRARAAALGGTLTVEAPAGGVGTEVRLSIPVDSQANPPRRAPPRVVGDPPGGEAQVRASELAAGNAAVARTSAGAA